MACSVLRLLGARQIPAVGLRLIDTGCSYSEKHNLISEDGERLREASSVPIPPLVAAPYRVAPDKAPADALTDAGLELDFGDLQQAVREAARFGRVVVELPGDANTELIPGLTSLQFALRLDGPLVVVASQGQQDIAQQAAEQILAAGQSAVVVPIGFESTIAGSLFQFEAGDDIEVDMFRHLDTQPDFLNHIGLKAAKQTS